MIVNDARGDIATPAMPNLLEVAKRRRYTIALAMVLGVGTSLLGYMQTPPTFVSEAVLVLDVRRVQINDAVVTPMPQDSPVLRTQLDIISSRMMAAQVLSRLQDDGVVLHAHRPSDSAMTTIVKQASRVIGRTEPVSGDTGGMPGPSSADQASDINILLSNLTVSNDGRSYTIFISYRAADPELAALVANTFAQTYLDHQIEVQRSAGRSVNDWLGETIVSLHGQLQQSEKALEAFRQKAGLVETNGVSLQAQAVADGNSELIAVRAALAGAQARLETVRRLASEKDTPALAEFLASPSIQALRAEQAKLERELDALTRSGAVKNRQVGVLTSELASLREQIASEVDQILQSLANETEITRQKMQKLEETLQAAQADLAQANESQLTAAQLEREANANRTIYESYLVRYKQTIEQDGFVLPEAQMISKAEPAGARAAPRLSSWLLLGLVGGFGLAMAGTVLRELTDRRMRLPGQLEAATGIPVIGAVPVVTRGLARLTADAGNTATPFGKALSTLRMMLRSSKKAVVSITSASKGQGKSTIALGLARSASAAGLRTVLVDANLRDPAIAKLAGFYPSGFMQEVLDGERRIDAVLQKDSASDVRIVAARAGASGSERVLDSAGFQTLIADLKSSFDLVIIDTPGVEQALDAAIVGGLCNRNLFVVSGDADRVDAVAGAIRRLSAAGCRPDGLILNRRDDALAAEILPDIRSAMKPQRTLHSVDDPGRMTGPVQVVR
ncbi:polysaccharide biosynthesis tyrosine autokinase [Mesorhizobium sp. CAU 1732]|uniref:GumC family protein n=1 Tax=Mesorhizobium sp. CAU 1732 TaxID=3140358 RepID=UPI00326129D6